MLITKSNDSHQATLGKCTSTRPGFFDYRARAKWDAWSLLGDLSSKDAKIKYVSKVADFLSPLVTLELTLKEPLGSLDLESDILEFFTLVR